MGEYITDVQVKTEKCDEDVIIAVVDNGEITEQGSHEELLSLDGTYSTLYKQQFRAV